MSQRRQIKDFYFDNRKRAILWLLWDEPQLTHVAIAERLGVSKGTIEWHFGQMYEALAAWGVVNDLSLIVALCKAGWFIEENRPGYKPEPSALVGAVLK